jgi:hypothetical protein
LLVKPKELVVWTQKTHLNPVERPRGALGLIRNIKWILQKFAAIKEDCNSPAKATHLAAMQGLT